MAEMGSVSMTAMAPGRTVRERSGGVHAARRRPARVCQLVHSLNVGGAELLAATFARRLGGPDGVVFACLDEDGLLGETLRSEGYVVQSLSRRPGLDRACARRLAEFWIEHDVDLIHAHQYTPFVYAALARGLGRRPPILFTEHGRFFPDHPNWKRRLVSPWLVGKSDRVVAVGECVKRALVENDGVPARRVEVIYNGVDVDACDSTRVDREEARRSLGLRPGDLAILTVARLDSIKDHPTAMDAMARLKDHASAVLLLAGDGPERSSIEAGIASRGLEQRVRLLGTRRDVPKLLAACDVFLLNSVSEGIPLTVLEAMSAARAVVATRVGGLPEIVEENQTGLLVNTGSPLELSAALGRLLEDADLRQRLGTRGRQVARSRFGLEAMISAYDRLYEEMRAG